MKATSLGQVIWVTAGVQQKILPYEHISSVKLVIILCGSRFILNWLNCVPAVEAARGQTRSWSCVACKYCMGMTTPKHYSQGGQILPPPTVESAVGSGPSKFMSSGSALPPSHRHSSSGSNNSSCSINSCLLHGHVFIGFLRLQQQPQWFD